MFRSATRQGPHVAVSLVVDGGEIEALGVDTEGLDGDVRLGDELLGLVGLQVPDVDDPGLVSDNQLLLVRMQRHTSNWSVGLVNSLT